MSKSDINYEHLFNTKKEMSAWKINFIDKISWLLPIGAAILSVSGGIAALKRADQLSAWLGIFGGLAGALGVIFTGYASRIRDRRLEDALNLGALGVDMAARVQSQITSNF
jgi:hypothetical protein